MCTSTNLKSTNTVKYKYTQYILYVCNIYIVGVFTTVSLPLNALAGPIVTVSPGGALKFSQILFLNQQMHQTCIVNMKPHW